MAITARLFLGSLVLLSVAFGANPVFSCGPIFPEALFTHVASDEMIRGNVGVIHSSYKSYYLVPAYRHLEGLGMGPEEKQAMLSMDNGKADAGRENWFNQWVALRNTVIQDGKPVQPRSYYWDGVYRYEVKDGHEAYLNCHSGAFRSAVNTLRDRIGKFGRDSAEVAEWTRGQDTVFSNCEKGHHIPGPVDKAMDKLIRHDRDYQIAAAHFYAGDFVKAGELFEKIARERSSPWSGLSGYLAARAFVREGTVNGENRTVNVRAMAGAEAMLQSILGDKTLSQYHAPARDLLGYARAMSNPAEYTHGLAMALTQKNPGRDMFKCWKEYSYMLRKMDDQTRKRARGSDDLTDWILTVQDENRQSLEHAVKKWRETSKSSWLVAAISKIASDHPDMPPLLSAAGKIKSGSPAYQSVQYHMIRLLVESGKHSEARKSLDSLYADGKIRLSPADANLFHGLRFRTSSDVGEFVRYAQRKPVCIGDTIEACAQDPQREDAAKYEKVRYLDTDAETVINEYMPLDLLRRLSEIKELEKEIRKHVAMAAFARAAVTRNDSAVADTLPTLSRFFPEAKKLLSDLAKAGSAEEKRFLAAYLMLQYPAMKPYVTSSIGRGMPDGKIDSYRRNWWCSFKQGTSPLVYTYVDPNVQPGTKASGKRKNLYPLFLSKADMEQTERELQDLMQIASGPTYLLNVVLKWAEKNSGDPRIPHALHLAVRSSRYGCTDKDTTSHSKRAFTMLHKRYPKNKWTKQTPYYFYIMRLK
jgi:hypothetical protein